MPQQIDKNFKFFLYIFIFIFLSSINNLWWIKTKDSIFKISEIEVTGLKEELNYNIKKKLNFIFGENIFFINSHKIKKELNNINYIENYKIKKYFPSKLKINIKKTKILAQAFNNNKKYYIGSNRRKIDNLEEIDNKNYPTIFGEFSVKEFIKLRNIIYDSQFDLKNITNYYYFKSKRWDIKLKNGTLIKLPRENIHDAIVLVKNIISKNINNQKKIIDLRMEEQIIFSNG
tara:strand:+ start:146 stop:838 length:693 start_codon:yes stop_codon:yes gene_type:complete